MQSLLGEKKSQGLRDKARGPRVLDPKAGQHRTHLPAGRGGAPGFGARLWGAPAPARLAPPARRGKQGAV